MPSSSSILLALLVCLGTQGVVVSAACSFPNGTDVTYHWWQSCDSPITFLNATPVNPDGSLEYPVSLVKPCTIDTTVVNKGHVYSQIYLSLKVWEWGSSAGTCGWVQVPTFGLLDNMDGCTNGIPCPINLGGPQDLTAVIDMSKYAQIVRLLKNDAPYQVELTIQDRQTSDKACLIIQLRAETQ